MEPEIPNIIIETEFKTAPPKRLQLKTEADLKAEPHNVERYQALFNDLLTVLPLGERMTEEEYQQKDPDEQRAVREKVAKKIKDYRLRLNPISDSQIEEIKNSGTEVLSLKQLEGVRIYLDKEKEDIDEFNRLFEFDYTNPPPEGTPEHSLYLMVLRAANGSGIIRTVPNNDVLLQSQANSEGYNKRALQRWQEEYFTDNERNVFLSTRNIVDSGKVETFLRFKDGRMQGNTVGEVANEMRDRMIREDASDDRIENEILANQKRLEAICASIPYKTMLRNPNQELFSNKLQVDHLINYFNNCKDLHDFLNESFFTDPQSHELTISSDFINVLADHNSFKSWLLECHRIMCTGRYGDSLYAGFSMVNLPRDFAGSLRPRDFITNAFISDIDSIVAIAEKYNDPLQTLPETYSSRRGKVVLFEEYEDFKKPADVDETIHIPKDSFDTYPDLPVGVLVVHTMSNVDFFFPGTEYIDDYIDNMRQHMIQVFSNLQDGNFTAGLDHLFRYYQTGIRSQAVAGVWNSVLMEQMNRILEATGCNRMSHHNFDSRALCLQPETFSRYMIDVVNQNSSEVLYLEPTNREHVLVPRNA